MRDLWTGNFSNNFERRIYVKLNNVFAPKALHQQKFKAHKNSLVDKICIQKRILVERKLRYGDLLVQMNGKMRHRAEINSAINLIFMMIENM